ncbi:AfsR/SARP family transcriptional regulator [Streptomyces sp. KR80]|uniref:AfsR/SARP family transcriptional regulator n=1 Tax=Streptomyces sp. KR80 TaxID=3457426 RepID=UPI003FD0A668
MDASTVEFKVLGPLEVWAAGSRLPLGGTRQRKVLAVLLMEAGRVVSVDRLVDTVWEDRPPATAPAQVKICVSALRRTFAAAGAPPELIVTRSPGYLLCAGDGQLDARRFEQLATQARGAAQDGFCRASEQARAALALWRGPALDGIGGRIIDAEARRLDEWRLSLLEECLEWELALGRHGDLVGELCALVAEHPLRERLHGHLMLALYRSGRQAEALEAYQRARQTIVEELGLEPNSELQRLHQAVLARDPSLEPPAPDTAPQDHEPAGGSASTPGPRQAPAEPPRVPQQLPTGIACFTGREKQLARIRDAFRADPGPGGSSGAVVVCAIAGRAGVGKTALAIQVAHELRDEFPDGQLYVDLQGGQDHPADPVAVLARFLGAFGVDGRVIPQGLDERAAMYRDRLAGRRVLVVLDNAADEAQVAPLLPGSASCAVLVTGRARLAGIEGAQLLDLDVLDAEQSVGLLAQIIGSDRVSADPGQALELAGLCGHLPLALRIAGARLATRPHWTVGRLVHRLADERRRLDELVHGGREVRSSLALSCRGLDEQQRRLFHRLGLLDVPDFAAWVGAALLDATVAEAEERIDQLVDAQLLDVVGRDAAGQTRYRFHDLTRVYAREGASAEPEPDRLAALSRAFGCWLALAERAHADIYGGDFVVLHGGAERFHLDPPSVEDLVDDALAWCESERLAVAAIVRQTAELGLDELCWDLAVTSVSFLETRNYFDEWRFTHEQALEATRRTGNLRGQAAVRTALGLLELNLNRYEPGTAWLGPALDAFMELGDLHGCALALPLLAYVETMCGQYDSALSRFEQALEWLRQTGDRGGEVLVLRSIGQIHLDLGRTEEAASHLEHALAIVRDSGVESSHPQLLDRAGELYLAQRKIEQAERAYRDMLAIVRRLTDDRGEAFALLALGRVLLSRELLVDADALLTQALSLGRKIGDELIEARVLLALGDLRHRQGRPAEAIGLLNAAVDLCEQMHTPIYQARVLRALGSAHLSTGDPRSADAAWRRSHHVLTELGSREADDVDALRSAHLDPARIGPR